MKDCLYSYDHAWSIVVTHTKRMRRERNAFLKSLGRCSAIIKEKKDYSFLHRIGSFDENELCFRVAYTYLFYDSYFNSALLIPFTEFVHNAYISNPFLFYRDSEITPLRTVPSDVFYELLCDLSYELQVSTIERISDDVTIRQALYSSINNKDQKLFEDTVEKCWANASRVSCFLAIYKETDSLELKTRADLISAIANIQSYVSNCTFPTPPIEDAPTLYKGYLTRNNCVEKFVNTYDVEHTLFEEALTLFASLRNYQGDIVFQDALSLFYKDNGIYPMLIKWLKSIGVYDLYFNDKEGNAKDITPKGFPSLQILPHPLPQSHVLLGGQHRITLLFKSLFKMGLLRKEDMDVFTYLLGFSDIAPISIRRIVWLGDKYELKCLMEVLYPNRRLKEKPNYGDMAKIFSDKNGEQINLKDTPLQCRKKTINDPVQAAREEAFIRKIQIILGVL